MSPENLSFKACAIKTRVNEQIDVNVTENATNRLTHTIYASDWSLYMDIVLFLAFSECVNSTEKKVLQC